MNRIILIDATYFSNILDRENKFKVDYKKLYTLLKRKYAAKDIYYFDEIDLQSSLQIGEEPELTKLQSHSDSLLKKMHNFRGDKLSFLNSVKNYKQIIHLNEIVKMKYRLVLRATQLCDNGSTNKNLICYDNLARKIIGKFSKIDNVLILSERNILINSFGKLLQKKMKLISINKRVDTEDSSK